MTLYLKGLQKYDRSSNFDLLFFLMPLKVQGHTVPHWKALNVKDGSSRHSCGSTRNIHQDVVKIWNLPTHLNRALLIINVVSLYVLKKSNTIIMNYPFLVV